MLPLHWPLKFAHLEYYLRLIRFDRPIGTLLLLYPCLTALVLAGDGSPSIKNLIIFGLGTFLMRSAGCAINDFADRHWDGAVERTENRPLAKQLITPSEALLVCAILTLIAFVLVLFTNTKTILLSFVAAALAALYPFTKRFTYLPQLFLGMAFSWSIPMAFAAESAPLTLTTWLLFLASILWTVAYDTIYAMADREDDIKVGIRSTALLFGRWDRLAIGLLQTAVLLIFYLIGQLNGFGAFFIMTTITTALLFIYQQKLISDRSPVGCIQAFLNNQWVGLTLLAGTTAAYHF